MKNESENLANPFSTTIKYQLNSGHEAYINEKNGAFSDVPQTPASSTVVMPTATSSSLANSVTSKDSNDIIINTDKPKSKIRPITIIIIIAIVVLIGAGVFIGITLLTGNNKKSSMNKAPATASLTTVQNCETPFDDLTAETAFSCYLEAVKDKNYAISRLTNDKDLLLSDNEIALMLLSSYADSSELPDIFANVINAAGLNLPDQSTEPKQYDIIEKEYYAIVTQKDCETFCFRGVSFNKLYLDYYFNPDSIYNTPTTNIDERQIKFIDTSSDFVEIAMPIIDIINNVGFAYSGNIDYSKKSYSYTSNTISIDVYDDTTDAALYNSNETPYVIVLYSITTKLDAKTGELSTETNINSSGYPDDVRTFPLTDQQLSEWREYLTSYYE